MEPASLSLRRVIRAPRERVFAAWTTPDQLRQWWGPGLVTCPEAHIDLREGGEYRLANRQPDGGLIWIFGRFERVRAPEEVVYTWNLSSRPDDAPTLVTVTFLPHDDGTELILRHERFVGEPIRDMHLQGWGGCIDKLEALFAA